MGAGTYEVEVATTNPNNSSINATTSAENMFAIEAVGSGSPAVYGQDRMCVYNNLWSGIQQFYLAKVDQPTGSGKTLEIDLFDPGDVGDGNATLQILGPSGSGGTQQLVRFNYTTDSNCGLTGSSDACSDTNVSQITTALNGSSSFGNTWIYIDVPLGTSYGSGGLWQGGWWQIQYTVGSENDTTTWSANVVGNPVHLVPMPVATPAAT